MRRRGARSTTTVSHPSRPNRKAVASPATPAPTITARRIAAFLRSRMNIRSNQYEPMFILDSRGLDCDNAAWSRHP
ncbi:hypothetical protein GCM10010532_035890 [Dactylosporangium siamense]